MEASRWRYVVWACAAVYALGAAAVALRHEPWADEAQAWLIARDSNPIEMAVDVLRYEGHPILWYLVLTPFAKTLPYGSMTVVAVLFGIAGALLWTLRSPVPLAVRLAVPFTYFLFYQYAVVARSYVLLPLLMFWLAHEYPRRHERPWRFVLICALLTFTSVFPAVGAGCLMLAFFVEALMRRAELSAEQKQRYWLCFGAYVAAGLFLVYQLWQPRKLHLPPLASQLGKGVQHGKIRAERLHDGAVDLDAADRRRLACLVLFSADAVHLPRADALHPDAVRDQVFQRLA